MWVGRSGALQPLPSSLLPTSNNATRRWMSARERARRRSAIRSRLGSREDGVGRGGAAAPASHPLHSSLPTGRARSKTRPAPTRASCPPRRWGGWGGGRGRRASPRPPACRPPTPLPHLQSSPATPTSGSASRGRAASAMAGGVRGAAARACTLCGWRPRGAGGAWPLSRRRVDTAQGARGALGSVCTVLRRVEVAARPTRARRTRSPLAAHRARHHKHGYRAPPARRRLAGAFLARQDGFH